MNAHQTINDWLSKINPGDKGLVLDRYGQCPLVGDDETCNVLVPSLESTAFSLYADIWYLPNEANATAYEELLALNLLGMKTMGCILGFDKKLRSLVLSYSKDIGSTDIKAFCMIVENFFVVGREMKKQLTSIFKSEAQPEASKPRRTSLLHKAFLPANS
jgi:hypothetical protein